MTREYPSNNYAKTINDVFERKDSASILLKTSSTWLWWVGSHFPFLQQVGQKDILFSEIKLAFDNVLRHLNYVAKNERSEDYPEPPCMDCMYCRLLSVVEREFGRKSDGENIKKCDREKRQRIE